MEVPNCNYNPEEGLLNQACLIFDNEKSNCDWTLLAKSSFFGVDLKNVTNIHHHSLQTLIFNADYYYEWKLENKNCRSPNAPTMDRNISCEMKTRKFDYGAIYKVKIVDDKDCEFFEDQAGLIKNYTPLFYIFGIIFCILALISLYKMIIKTYLSKRGLNESRKNSVITAEKSKSRIQSIDTFRGLCILLMIFVNDGAGGYTYLNHQAWNGIYLADLVFPCFIWIMGFCIPMSIKSQRQKSFSSFTIYKKIIKRSILLFLIGICLNSIGGTNQLEKIRIFGVLQRCAVGYFFVSILYNLLTLKDRHYNKVIFRVMYNIIVLIPQWFFMLIILAVHWYLTFHHSFPGCELGYVGPGGDTVEKIHEKCPGGAAGYIDKVILGNNHMLENSIVDTAFGSGPFEPEGILGCLTTIFHTFLGLQAGNILMLHKRKWKNIICRYFIWSLLTGSIGLYLHFFIGVPINKSLWSLSFVLVTTSIALIVMSIFFILIDVLKWWKGGPFRIPGMNAITLYIGSQIFYKSLPFHWKYGEHMDSNHWLLTSEAVWDAGLWAIIAYIMHHNKIYINL